MAIDLTRVGVTDHARERWHWRSSPEVGYDPDPPPIYDAIAESVHIGVRDDLQAYHHDDTGTIFLIKPRPRRSIVVTLLPENSMLHSNSALEDE